MIELNAEIQIKKENKYPFRIGFSKLGEDLFGKDIDRTEKINKRNILSLDSEIRDRAEKNKPNFGLISSGGALSFKDNNKVFLKYANTKLLDGNEKVLVFLENKLAKNREKVGEYYTQNWKYDNNNGVVSVSLIDGLEDMQNKNIGDISLLNEQEEKTLYDFYLMVKASLEENGYKLKEISENLTEFMKNVSVKYPYFSRNSAWNYLLKISTACMANSYKGKDGLIYTME